MNSDGQYSQILATIIAVLGLIVIVGYFNILNVGVQEGFEDQACKRQVQQHAASLQLSGRQFSSEVRCGTDVKTVEDEVKRTVARELSRCWDTFLEGSENLFNGAYTYCHPCAVLELEQGADNFGDYLASTERLGGNGTYLEYLSGYTSERARQAGVNERLTSQDGHEQFLSASLEPGQRYAVLFVYAKGTEHIRNLGTHLTDTTSQGIAIGTAAAAGTFAWIFASGGWGLVIGAGSGVVAEIVTYVTTTDTAPEWASVVVLEEYSDETLKKYNCERDPIGGS